MPTDVTSLLSDFGAPAGAVTLAFGLVRGARALEKDAKESALKDVATLLMHGSLENFGKLASTLVPTLFDKIFGENPLMRPVCGSG
jgi:hypothetical protein